MGGWGSGGQRECMGGMVGTWLLLVCDRGGVWIWCGMCLWMRAMWFVWWWSGRLGGGDRLRFVVWCFCWQCRWCIPGVICYWSCRRRVWFGRVWRVWIWASVIGRVLFVSGGAWPIDWWWLVSSVCYPRSRFRYVPYHWGRTRIGYYEWHWHQYQYHRLQRPCQLSLSSMIVFIIIVNRPRWSSSSSSIVVLVDCCARCCLRRSSSFFKSALSLLSLLFL